MMALPNPSIGWYASQRGRERRKTPVPRIVTASIVTGLEPDYEVLVSWSFEPRQCVDAVLELHRRIRSGGSLSAWASLSATIDSDLRTYTHNVTADQGDEIQYRIRFLKGGTDAGDWSLETTWLTLIDT